MSDIAPKKEKKEKKDKKRKSDAADLAVPTSTTPAAVAPIPVPPAEGTASAEAVTMEVDGEKAAKKAKKEKKEKRKSLGADAAEEGEGKSEFFVPTDAISPIAHPLAPRKLQKKIFRTVKKASKARQLKRGVKETVKALRKGEKGLLLLASNITPVDVISHMPLLAEEAVGVEYCWVLSKEELGAASGTKRATSCVLISPVPAKRSTPKDGATPVRAAPTAEELSDLKESLDECMKEVAKLEVPVKF